MDWKRVSKLLDNVKEDAEELTLDEFVEKYNWWYFPFWDKWNKHPDHDEQLFCEDKRER